MSNFYTCTHFDIRELVDQDTYLTWGEKAWMFLRPEALMALDGIREYFNKVTIVNNWTFGREMQYRGFRPPSCTIGATLSQHRFGNAFDLDVEGVSGDEVRQAIIANKDDPRFIHITTLETGVTYVHFDCRNIPDRIRLITA